MLLANKGRGESNDVERVRFVLHRLNLIREERSRPGLVVGVLEIVSGSLDGYRPFGFGEIPLPSLFCQ